jgi:hypothetical protein
MLTPPIPRPPPCSAKNIKTNIVRNEVNVAVHLTEYEHLITGA